MTVHPPQQAAPVASRRAEAPVLPVKKEIRTGDKPAGGNGDTASALDFLLVREDLPDRRLRIDTPFEPIWKRTLFLFIALAVCGLHIGFTHTYWAPAHWGNNQNAYLSAGKLLATTGTTGFEPTSPFEFVGWMWNMADETSAVPAGGWHYPKYPIGVPLLNAIAYKLGGWVGGPATAVDFMLKVPPLCVTAATLAVFFITRLLAGSFAGILAMIGFSLLTVIVVLTNNPYSHAADVCFVTWGMFALLKWWQKGGWWRGAIAGFLIGYAATIRYTEGLLVLPLLAAVMCTMRWHRPKFWIAAWSWFGAVLISAFFIWLKKYGGEKETKPPQMAVILTLATAAAPILAMIALMIRDRRFGSMCRAAIPLFAWLLPLVALVIWNKLTIGGWTGYDSTNESTGFTREELARKWRWGIDQFYNTGLYFLLPLSLFGMFAAFKWNWRVALVLMLWYVPGTVLYLSYYWGMNLPVWGFLRFFASGLPAGVIAAVWAMQRATAGTVSTTTARAADSVRPLPMDKRRAILAGVIVVGVAALAAYVASIMLDGESVRYTSHLVLAGVAGALIAAAAVGAGRGAAAPIAMGLMIAFPTCINVDTSVGAMERDFTIATNLAQVGVQCRRHVEPGSVVFGNSQFLLNYLQFAGDYKLIGSDYLQGSRPVPGMGRGDSDDPTPIQPARKKHVDKVYGEMNREKRFAEAIRVVEESWSKGKKAYIVLDAAGAAALRDGLRSTPSAKNLNLEFETVARWTDPAKFTLAAIGSLGTIGRDGWSRREPWKWQIVEVKRGQPPVEEAAPPTTAPTTNPTTTPSQ